ncbi:TATA element modulatory factor [Centruroides vittatus]|uniref:TATA element modulatory factor n=1 Tax=Centruroides vittatus TaxID=120091 RepID=UPI00350FA34C
MNWFDTAGFANLAKSAFTSAQKTIDRALDIRDDEAGRSSIHMKGGDESFFAAYGLKDKKELPKTDDKKQSSKEENLPSDDNFKERSWNDWGSFFDYGNKNQSSESHFSKDTSSDKDKGTVLSQPQQRCAFPSGTTKHDTSEEMNRDFSKDDSEYDSCKESDVKIEAHLTITERLTELSPSLLQKSLDKPEGSVQLPQNLLTPAKSIKEEDISEKLLTSKENVVTNIEKLDSGAVNESASPQIDSEQPPVEFCVVKHSSSNTLESSSLLVLSTSTGDDFSSDLSPQQVNIENYGAWEPNSDIAQNEKNAINDENQIQNLTESTNICVLEDDGHLSSAESVVPVSDDLYSLDSPEQINDDNVQDHANDLQDHWFISSRDQSRDIFRDQTSTESELKDEESETPELKEYDIKSSDSVGSAGTNSSSSFVKCSVGEADSSYSHRGNSESCTTSEHSDNQKYEIEHLSGHTSGEENETTTSSDIEIISLPNGENGEKHSSMHLKSSWMSRSYGRRSESPNSDSSIMPAVQEVEEDGDQHLQQSLYKDDETLIDCEDDMEASRKTIIGQTTNIAELIKRQTELEEILENREKRVLDLSKEAAELHDSNSFLEREVKRLEELRNKDSRHTSELTQEFTHRLAQLENKLSEASKERDIAKQKLEALEEEAVSRLSATEVEKMLKEKDQLISELMDEGEKLSKQQLQHTSLIKKLRNKDKERENLLKTQKETLEEQSKELERLRKSLGAKDDQEKKHIEKIRQLTITIQQKEKDLSFIKADLDNSMETVNSLKKSLDNSYKEIIELQKASAEKESQAQEMALSTEIAAKEELQQALEHVRKESVRERETLLAQLEELQQGKIKIQKQFQCREEALQSEMTQLQKRLQESEKNTEELTKQISSATLPLLRQIDNLQSTLVSQSASWEKTEESLYDKINDLQRHLDLSEKKESILQKKYDNLSSKISDLEMQVNILKQEKAQLSTQLELSQMKVLMLEESKNKENVSVAAMKQTFAEDLNRLKDEKDSLIHQIETLQLDLENERLKVQKYQEQLNEKNNKQRSESGSNGTSSPTISRLSSVSDRLNYWMQDSHEPSLGMSSSMYSNASLYETLRLGSASSLLENLQSQLKQREGEISLFQSEIAQLERIRGSMAKELADVSCQYEMVKSELEEMKNMKTAYADMEQKYNTLLQMYGEKVEETEELQLDLQDVKAMYRAQLDELLKKS